jgi:hypothetical protein
MEGKGCLAVAVGQTVSLLPGQAKKWLLKVLYSIDE